ncbi:MAG: class III poly(R)-hydroxyalkanoic acid synthase subunit PhaE [Limnoraphis robusta]
MDRDTTTWTKMASHLTNVWVETGTQMWKSWFDLMDDSASADDTATEPSPDFKSAAQRFANNQELFVRFIKLSFEAWKEVFPKAEAGEDWQQVLKKYTQQMRTQLDQFSAETLKTSQDTAQLWQLYIKEMQKFSQLWTATLGVSMKPMGKGVNGATEPWLELNNLYWNLLYEETFGSLMQSPVLGPSREFHGKVLRAFDAWANVYRGSIDYQIVLADIQIRSFEELMQELISLAEKGKKVEDWRQVQRLWSAIADRVFEKEFCKEDNLKIRGNFLNALNTYRLHQQELMELWLKTMNMPVRSEVDEVHKNIYELRKQIKTLNKQLARYEAIEREPQQFGKFETLNPQQAQYGASEQEIQQLRQQVETLNRQSAKYYEASEQEIQQLRQQVETLNQQSAKYEELEQEIQQLRQQLETLNQQSAKYEASEQKPQQLPQPTKYEELEQETQQLRQELEVLKQTFTEFAEEAFNNKGNLFKKLFNRLNRRS